MKLSLAQKQLCRASAPLPVLITTFRITGVLDEGLLGDAITHVVAKTPALRLRMRAGAGQEVLPAGGVSANMRMVRVAARNVDQFDRWVRLDVAQTATPLTTPEADDSLHTVTLYRLDKRYNVLAIAASHLALDGRSTPAVADLVFQHYFGTSVDCPPRAEQDASGGALGDQIAWEWEQTRQSRPPSAAHWAAGLVDCPSTIRFADAPTTVLYEPVQAEMNAPHLRALARELRCSPFTMVLAAFAAELFTHTEQDRLAVWVPVDTRGPRARAVTGMLSMSLPLPFERREATSTTSAYARAREKLLGALSHRHVDPETLDGLVTRLADEDTDKAVLTHLRLGCPSLQDGDSTRAVRVDEFSHQPRRTWGGGPLLTLVELADGGLILRAEYGCVERARMLLEGVLRRLRTPINGGPVSCQ